MKPELLWYQNYTKALQEKKQQMKIFMNIDANTQQNTSKPNSAAYEKDHPMTKWDLFLERKYGLTY